MYARYPNEKAKTRAIAELHDSFDDVVSNRDSPHIDYFKLVYSANQLVHHYMLGMYTEDDPLEVYFSKNDSLEFKQKVFQRAGRKLYELYGITDDRIPCNVNSTILDQYKIPDDVPVYIFLDIDGVLNSVSGAIRRNGWDNGYDLHDENMRPLELLIANIGKPRIVISSTHRIGKTLDDMKTMFSDYTFVCDNIVGITPRDHSERRYSEIQLWLYNCEDRDKSDSYTLILDDESDVSPPVSDIALNRNTIAIRTDNRVGLSFSDVSVGIHDLYQIIINNTTFNKGMS